MVITVAMKVVTLRLTNPVTVQPPIHQLRASTLLPLVKIALPNMFLRLSLTKAKVVAIRNRLKLVKIRIMGHWSGKASSTGQHWVAVSWATH